MRFIVYPTTDGTKPIWMVIEEDGTEDGRLVATAYDAGTAEILADALNG